MREQTNIGFSRFLHRFLFFPLVFVISGLSILLPAFLFSPVEKTTEKEEEDRRFTVMLNQTPTLMNDPFDLAYWLIYCDPRSFSLPDWNDGYSSFLRGGSRTLAEHEIPSEDLSLTRMFSSPENPLVSGIRTPDHLLSRLRPEIPRPLPDLPVRKQEKISYPRWTDLSGTELGNLFEGNQNLQPLLLREKPNGNTILRIEYVSENMPPSVRVTASCGSKALDVLAAGTFSACAARNMNSTLFRKIEYAVVEWKSPREGKK